ncbi:MAG: hypothetical protein ACD_75C00731G0002, partial [uncultured bacterium]
EQGRFVAYCLIELGRHPEDPVRGHVFEKVVTAVRARKALGSLLLHRLQRLAELDKAWDYAVYEPARTVNKDSKRLSPLFAFCQDSFDAFRRALWHIVSEEGSYPTARDMRREILSLLHVWSERYPREDPVDTFDSWLTYALADTIFLSAESGCSINMDRIAETLCSKHAWVRRAVYLSMLSLGSPCIDPLFGLLHRKAAPKWIIGSLLTKLGRQGSDKIVEYLKHPDASLRNEAIRVLSLLRDRRVLPLVRKLVRATKPQERRLGLFCLHQLMIEDGKEEALLRLGDTHPDVRRMAQWYLRRLNRIRVTERIQQLWETATNLQKEGFLQFLADIGGDAAKAALPRESETPDSLKSLRDTVDQILRAGLFLPDLYPVFRYPPGLGGLSPNLWALYIELAELPAGPPVPLYTDEEILDWRERCLLDLAPWRRGYLLDMLSEYTNGARDAVVAYRSLSLSLEESDEALLTAIKNVDKKYLAAEWQRDETDPVLGSDQIPQWIQAVCHLFENRLIQRSSQKDTWLEGDLPEDEKVRLCWERLRGFTDLYFGYHVRPALSPDGLARFVLNHYRKADRKPASEDTRIVREIVDYLAFQCAVRPGSKTWRKECAEALWNCFEPMRDRVHNNLLKESIEYDDPEFRSERLQKAKERLRDIFEEALEEYNPFLQEWGEKQRSKPEPVNLFFPLGDLALRSHDVRQSRGFTARRIRFPGFLEHRVNREFPRPKTSSEKQHSDPEEEGVTISGLSRQTGFSEKVLRAAEALGEIEFKRPRSRRKFPNDAEKIEQLRNTLQFKRQLRNKSDLAKMFFHEFLRRESAAIKQHFGEEWDEHLSAELESLSDPKDIPDAQSNDLAELLEAVEREFGFLLIYRKKLQRWEWETPKEWSDKQKIDYLRRKAFDDMKRNLEEFLALSPR